MYIIKKEFRLSKNEIKFLNSLPSNLPDTKLSKKEINEIDRIYRYYITNNVDNQSYYSALYEIELKERWSSGQRLKNHEAKRIPLNNLLNSSLKMTNKEAARNFLVTLSCRESYLKLTREIYELKK